MTYPLTIRAVSALFLAIFMSSSPALAQKDEARLWSGQLEFGATVTSGNTDTDNFTGRFELLRSSDPWRNLLRVDGLYTTDNDVTSAQRFTVFTQQDYKFTEHDYAFHKLRYENDRFNGFDYEASSSLGYGRRLVDQAPHQLNLEIGLGFRHLKLEDSGEREDSGLLVVGGEYHWQISESAKFEQLASSEIGSDNTISRATSKLSVAINSRFNLNASYEIRHNSEVQPDRKNTDTITAITLGYKF
jgi:putative salt-induced outer membrane protein